VIIGMHNIGGKLEAARTKLSRFKHGDLLLRFWIASSNVLDPLSLYAEVHHVLFIVLHLKTFYSTLHGRTNQPSSVNCAGWPRKTITAAVKYC